MSHRIASHVLPYQEAHRAADRSARIEPDFEPLCEKSPLPDEESDEPWDDIEPDEELEPLDDSELEIDEEPEPDDGDFWLDPDETEDPWN